MVSFPVDFTVQHPCGAYSLPDAVPDFNLAHAGIAFFELFVEKDALCVFTLFFVERSLGFGTLYLHVVQDCV